MALVLLNEDYDLTLISASETKIRNTSCARCMSYRQEYQIPGDYERDDFPPPPSFNSYYGCKCPEDPTVTHTCILILASGKSSGTRLLKPSRVTYHVKIWQRKNVPLSECHSSYFLDEANKGNFIFAQFGIENAISSSDLDRSNAEIIKKMSYHIKSMKCYKTSFNGTTHQENYLKDCQSRMAKIVTEKDRVIEGENPHFGKRKRK